MNPVITVHPLTNSPTAVWDQLSKTQKSTPLPIQNPSKPVEPGKVRIVCMSDTHSLTNCFKFDVPYGDILIHAGDFTHCGQECEVIKFNDWMKSLPHRYKIVICGNHELSFDMTSAEFHYARSRTKDEPVKDMRDLLTNCIYLEDSAVTLFGLKFYGSPWQPEHGGWAFNLSRGEQCLSKWHLIPDDTDILITHGPPLGQCDKLQENRRAGCVELLATVQKRVKPMYHVFGHIHEGYGMCTDGEVVYVNAATCNVNYMPKNLPIVFDVLLPEGQIKS